EPEVARVLAIQLAAKICDAMSPPYVVEGQAVDVAGSIGIALFPEHGLDWQTLMRRADSAMYAAKGRRSAFEVFATDLDEDAAARLTLLSDLRRALAGEDELEVFYQPKVDARSGSCTCVEALVRWRHPREGLLLPGRFVTMAEQSGLIRGLGLRVLEEALRRCRAWRDGGLNLKVAVNMSMRNLHDPSLPVHIRDLLERYGLEPSCLVIEVTESSIMADAARTMDITGMLAEMGVGLSIDDFGTGYSSLAYLKRLPVSELKIDRSFVQNMATDENDAAIVRSTIDLGHNLGLRVVAEGVESAEASERLAELGCDEAQGFYLAEPMPADQCLAWLQVRERVLSAEC
ncbi:MAG TPA: GGDEF domain-containing phosphodiesterase, partial [Chloroflexota bacterium]|nr:GGDEF domain-containing phosphodiesterase [Chloroflexota bacterium]